MSQIQPRHQPQDVGHQLFWKLLEPEHARAEAFCRQLAGSREEGDDLYQDSLLGALRKFRGLRDHTSFKPWLYRILVNNYRNRCRTPWWRKRTRLTAQAVGTQAGPDPVAAYTARRWLQRAMAVLSTDERALVSLYEFDGWTIGELAAMYRRPQGTIKARLARSRKKMRREIERYLQRHKEIKTNGAAHAFSQSQQASR
jgi:RNA polymerase sigma-70 factor (ECF subfamily)